MFHYLMWYYFNVQLFDNAVVRVVVVPVKLVIVARNVAFNVTVFYSCTISR